MDTRDCASARADRIAADGLRRPGAAFLATAGRAAVGGRRAHARIPAYGQRADVRRPDAPGLFAQGLTSPFQPDDRRSEFIRDGVRGCSQCCAGCRSFANEWAPSALAVVSLIRSLKHSVFRVFMAPVTPAAWVSLRSTPPYGSHRAPNVMRTPMRMLAKTLEQRNAPPGGRTQSLRRGRAAWMPREARQAMDGPSRRPQSDNGGGHPTQSGRMMGQALLVSFGWFGTRRLRK